MSQPIDSIILAATGARRAVEVGKIQDLWSGYGRISRYRLDGGDVETVVVKHVRYPPQKRGSGRGGDRSHNRKAKSYRVETAWYRDWSAGCGPDCRLPACLVVEAAGDDVVMVLEDLDAAGFGGRRSSVGWAQVVAGISWLASFHATFMGAKPRGLWRVGTYWHLETRPDELKALRDRALREAAADIDRALRRSPFQTFVHGDAKLANLCFSRDGRSVAAVDFQYVGGGCGMKDLAYFVSSCMFEEECARNEARILDEYFRRLRASLKRRSSEVDVEALEADWRALYPVAWADFHRFFKGWSPGHWRRDGYSERVARKVVARLRAGAEERA